MGRKIGCSRLLSNWTDRAGLRTAQTENSYRYRMTISWASRVEQKAYLNPLVTTRFKPVSKLVGF